MYLQPGHVVRLRGRDNCPLAHKVVAVQNIETPPRYRSRTSQKKHKIRVFVERRPVYEKVKVWNEAGDEFTLEEDVHYEDVYEKAYYMSSEVTFDKIPSAPKVTITFRSPRGRTVRHIVPYSMPIQCQ